MALFTGTTGNDYLNGGVEDDLISGDAGNDSINGGAGNDTIDGGAGSDYVSYDAFGPVTVNLALGTGTGTGAGTDTLMNIENILGGQFADILVGDANRNILSGGLGNDTLTGGAGSDTFQFPTRSGDISVDTITDFTPGEGGDNLNIFTFLLSNYTGFATPFPANPFSSGHARLVQSGTDTLFQLDFDGTGSAGSFQTLAILNNVVKGDLVASNFGGFSPNPIQSSLFADLLNGTSGADEINGLTGNDTINGQAGNDNLLGGPGDDEINGDAGSDRIYGNDGHDRLNGGADEDILEGGDGNDMLDAGTGNDTLTGGAGNDTIEGGTGVDRAVFTGNLANFTLSKTGPTYTVRSKTGTDGIDSLTNVESLQFSDKTINLTIQAKAAATPQADVIRLTELYVAFFNRVPDADGLAYWIDQKNAGQSISQIADVFYSAGVQYSDLTGFSSSMSNGDFVNVIYRNVLGRSEGADTEGLAYWSGQLATGEATRGSLVSSILDSAHSFKGNSTYGFVADLLDNKYAVAKTFAIDWGLNYNTPADSISQGMAIAVAVTPTSTTAAIGLIGLTANDIQLI